jgi:hypothetical protein
VSQPQEGVVVTLADIYRQVVELAGKVDAVLIHKEGNERALRDHEDRLRALERGRWPLASITVLIAIAAVVVATLNAIYGGK